MLNDCFRVVVVGFTILFFNMIFGQINTPGGVTCDDTGPICADNTGSFVFQNNNDSSTNINTSIACVDQPRRPAWFFLKVDQTGDLEFDIIQTSNTGFGLDVDFVAWGPFSSEFGNCNNIANQCVNNSGIPIDCPDNTDNLNFYTNNLDNTNIIDCSYSSFSTESLTINNAVSGEFYLLLVTNFQGGDGVIEIIQTNFGTQGGGSTDCSIINVDGILGPDIDVCDTGSANATLDANPSNDPDFVDFNWEFDDGTGFAPIPGTDGLSTINVSDSGTYQVTITGNNGDSDTDTIEVSFRSIPVANPVSDQLICDNNNDGFWDFNLNDLRTVVLGTQNLADFNVTFHNSIPKANSNTDPLPNIYTNAVAYTQEIITARIENVLNTDCFSTTSFSIDVFDQPTASTYTYQLCDNALDGDDTNGFVEFNLPSIDNQILGTQDPAQFTVTYHFDQDTADSGMSPLANFYPNITANVQRIYARVENNDNADCYETAIVDLVVNALPVITSPVQLIQCDDDSDGLSDFNLTEANGLISTNASAETFTYYTNFSDADNAAATAITNVTAYPNTDSSSTPDVLYVRVENASGCHRVVQLDLLVEATQIPSSVIIVFDDVCDTGSVDGDITNGITTFDLTGAEGQIRALSGLPTGQNLNFTFYETEADALAEENEIPDLTNHRNTASPFVQDIYVRIDGELDNACVGLGVHVRLIVANPTPRLDPPSIEKCDDNMVGDLVETFDLRENEAYIFNGDTGVGATYYLSYQDANDGINQIPNPSTYQNTDATETIYVRVTNSTTTCYAIVNFDITVNPLPEVSVAITDFYECENNTDFRFDFDLESKTDEILNGQNPADFTVTYHLTQSDADNLTNLLPNPYPSISNPQQIFVAITNNTTGCSISTLSFNIEVNEDTEANNDGESLLYEICDEVGDNDGSAQFDLSTLDDEIYDGQNPADFTLTYHETFDNALNNVIPLPTLYENRTNPQTIYARVSNNIRPNECYAITEVPLQVNLLPIFNLEERYVLCLSANSTAVIDIPPSIDTGLSPADYSFQWSLDGTPLPTETGASITPNQAGVYSVLVTDTSTSTVTSCQNSDSTEVIESGIPSLTLELNSQAFTGNNIIEATATGIGDYEYSLDDGPWQSEGVFTNVSGGDHVVTARDINGCGLVSDTILVIDYPLYFTPNGDGANDKWNITGIDTQPDAVIYIFDRYGKLLKQLSSTSEGWDGTFNGNDMPSSDYWFSLVYNEELTGQRKEFKSHFTLKR